MLINAAKNKKELKKFGSRNVQSKGLGLQSHRTTNCNNTDLFWCRVFNSIGQRYKLWWFWVVEISRNIVDNMFTCTSSGFMERGDFLPCTLRWFRICVMNVLPISTYWICPTRWCWELKKFLMTTAFRNDLYQISTRALNCCNLDSPLTTETMP